MLLRMLRIYLKLDFSRLWFGEACFSVYVELNSFNEAGLPAFFIA